MNSRGRLALVFLLLTTVAAGIVFLTTRNRASASLGLPDELHHYNPEYRCGLYANTSTEMSWVGFDTASAKVVITRNSRQDPAVPYAPADIQKQLLSASFEISSIAVGIDPSPTIDSIYVAGTDPTTGMARIERWKFSYGTGGAGALGSGPTETRQTIYTGTELVHIRSIDIDPDQRYVLVLTDQQSVYRLEIPSPTGGAGGPLPTPTLVADVTSVPELAGVTQLDHYLHVTDGHMFLLTSDASDSDTVVVRDSNDDGIVDGVDAYGASAWQASDYFELESYVPLFKTGWFPGPN